jgi:hypothetical protein
VRTPTAPRAVLPTKFAAAEKHMVPLFSAKGLHSLSQKVNVS